MTPHEEWSTYLGIKQDLESALEGIKKMNPTGTQMTSDMRRLKDMIQFYDDILENEFEDVEEESPSI